MVLLNSAQLHLGTEIKQFKLPDTTSENFYSNQDLDKDLVLIAFICNHCPYVIRIIKSFVDLAKKNHQDVQVIAISANDPDYNSEDSPENMKAFARKHNFCFPYLFDESQGVAKAFGAVCTPDLFLYQKQEALYKLTYHARLEDMQQAIDQLKHSSKIDFEPIPSAGCSIKDALKIGVNHPIFRKGVRKKT